MKPQIRTFLMVIALIFGFVAVAEPAGAIVDSAVRVLSPNPSGNTVSDRMESVSCVSSSFCMSVGSYQPALALQTVAFVWDGAQWTTLATPNPGGSASENRLSGVSCVSTSFCVAVGEYFNGTVSQTLVLLWDGVSWSHVSSPNTGPNDENTLNGVACTSATHCMAVGVATTIGVETLVLQWDGTAWTITPSPNPVGAAAINILTDVSCVSEFMCMVVGRTFGGNAADNIALLWDGAAFSDVSPPNRSPSLADELLGVTCSSATFCLAVGFYDVGSPVNSDRTSAFTWDGVAWTISPTANESSNQRTLLNSAACLDASFRVAVGRYNNGTTSQSHVQVWDGTTWAIIPSPSSAPNEYNTLYSVTCVTSYECMSVGRAGVQPERTLAVALTGPVPPAPDPEPLAPSFTG